MASIPVMRRATFEREDFDEMCLFTGAPVKRTKQGEHVIPRWLIDDYELNCRRIEMGWPGSLADIKQFRTRADPTANGVFGDLENRVKLGETSLDHVHLWQKKISVGMTLCHWRMARNKHHPLAPGDFDTRHLVFALEDFRSDFRKFSNRQPVPRNGSTLVLPTSVPGGWLAHMFGSVTSSGEVHDTLMPFGMIAVTHQNKLLVSVFYDPEREFESSRLVKEWKELKLDECSSAPRVAAALAVTYSEFLFKARAEALGTEGEGFDAVLKGIGYQLGVDIDPTTNKYQPRRTA
ncbi:MAG: hypothetical protein QM625_04075 [Ralstonia sp.]|uniref:Uncharacterized protein n=1 Tax=Ralstonia pickettii TaxID=329 RepID=A0A9Q2CCW9_RALPI|nr:hypothetical protein [Ralstonia pickettii]MBA9848139.1 hypothetical protein [Ralstonia pickettii]MBA9853650.1 hypothetical protein [Ralstonia pickettii]MBA9879670.1 hypothetical protein [Ralstonia pickettii]MBA9884573.1 hypothetical protein [Ralstonia pickettii]MBA9889663.1 hypothetical protein [Ralstonia pickettii]